MKTLCTVELICVLCALNCLAAVTQTDNTREYLAAIDHIKTLPKPPAGYESVSTLTVPSGRFCRQMIIKRAKEKQAHVVQLTSDKKRPGAIRFYEKFGFKSTHEGMKLHFRDLL